MALREPFNPHLFVGRERELEELKAWALALTVPRRLRTIIAPPGYGKSWLLAALADRLDGQPDLFLPIAPPQDLRTTPQIKTWLTECITAAQMFCPAVRPADSRNPPGTTIAQLTDDLLACASRLRIVLLVDGIDEISGSEQRRLEKELLEPFWACPAVRLAISFRNEHQLTSHILRRGEHTLTPIPFSQAEGGEQLVRRLDGAAGIDNPTREALLNQLAPYEFTIPGLNTLLADRFKRNQQAGRGQTLSAADLHDCWLALVGDSLHRQPQTVETLQGDLERMARYEARALAQESTGTWNLDAFADICGYSDFQAFNHLQSLMMLTLVTYTQRQQYKVVDGLRGFLLAKMGLNGSGQRPPDSDDPNRGEEA